MTTKIRYLPMLRSRVVGRLPWLARYASTKTSSRLPLAKNLDKTHARSVDRDVPRPPVSTPRQIRFLLPRTIRRKQEEWRDFKDHIDPKVRRGIWVALWLLPWVPIVVVFGEVVFTILVVEGPSMIPTLNEDFHPNEPNTKDLVLVKLWNGATHVKRGNVVALRSPQDPEKVVVKRIAAVEGDLVYPLAPFPPDPVLVQWGQLWLEGDNEDKSKSKDSNWYGQVPRGLVIGQVIAVIWPLHHIRNLMGQGWKDNPRVQKRVVRLASPDVEGSIVSADLVEKMRKKLQEQLDERQGGDAK